MRSPAALLGGQVVAEQATAGAGQVFALGLGLGGRLVGHKVGGPDLAVRMRVAGAHHGSAVLKDLHVLDPVQAAISWYSCVQASTTRRISCAGHASQGQAVVGMEAKHLAQAACGLGHQQRRGRRLGQRRGIRQQGRVIVYKREDAFIRRVYRPARPLVAGAQIALRIVATRPRARPSGPLLPARDAACGAAKPAPTTAAADSTGDARTDPSFPCLLPRSF